MHFDASVNHGVAGAARLLQQAVGAEVDGEVGPVTLAAARKADEARALAAYAEARRARYRALPHFWRFGRGWLRRVDVTLSRAVAHVAVNVARAEPNTPPSPSDIQPAEKGPTDMIENETGFDTTTEPKWWGESLTIWGVIVTTLATVLPVVGPLFGYDITADLVHQIGAQATQVIQAIGGLVGTLMTIVGRSRATAGLVRRQVQLKL
jgi:lysozyme family protein